MPLEKAVLMNRSHHLSNSTRDPLIRRCGSPFRLNSTWIEASRNGPRGYWIHWWLRRRKRDGDAVCWRCCYYDPGHIRRSSDLMKP